MIITVQGARYCYGSKLLDSEKGLSVYMALGSSSDGNHTGRRDVYNTPLSGSQARRGSGQETFRRPTDRVGIISILV